MSVRARVQHKLHPELTPTEIARRIGSTRQAVERAIASGGKLGRPGVESRTVRLSSALLDRASAAATREGIAAREWIEDAIAVRLLRKGAS